MRHRAAFPASRSYLWLALAGMAFVIYVSIMPFAFQAVPLDAALQRYETVLRAPRPPHVPRTNYLANVLLFVPIGFGLSGALLVERARRFGSAPALAILAVSLTLSLFVEFLQVFLPGRLSSRTDIEAQTLGCVAGIVIWAAAGPAITAWLRARVPAAPDDRLGQTLAAYAVVWAFVNCAPFDITLDPGDLARRLRSGLIAIAPFGSAETLARLLRDALVAFVAAIPLGALGLVGWTGRRYRRDARHALLFGTTVVALVEVAQIFIRSHIADTGHVLAGWLDVSVGVGLGRWLQRAG